MLAAFLPMVLSRQSPVRVLPAMLMLMMAQLAAAPVQDSTGVIAGIVTDSASSLPLAGAIVRVDGLTLVARPNPTAFRIEGVAPGAQWLDVSLAGYGRARPKVDFRRGAVVDVAVKLVADATPYLETVEVRPGANAADVAQCDRLHRAVEPEHRSAERQLRVHQPGP